VICIDLQTVACKYFAEYSQVVSSFHFNFYEENHMPSNLQNVETLALKRDLTSTFKGDINSLNHKVVEGRILETAIAQLAGRPGFNPAALSVVFGLKW
jgi:hypothetical protein